MKTYRHACVQACDGVSKFFFKLVYYIDSIHKVYKDKLQNCSCNQFHYTGTYKQVETNSMTKNRGENNGSEKWIEKTLRLMIG
jgi:hypothetical protein